MARQNNSELAIVTQGIEIPIDDFLGHIFGELEERERIVLVSAPAGKPPGYPMTREAFEKRARAYQSGKARWPSTFYFGTSTVALDVEGRIRNRNVNFTACWCVVADDIGTKIERPELPEYFQHPSWIIETSPANYQYGYIYETPIEDVEVAKAVVDQVTHGIGADTGGNIACKLVRLPLGVNGKPSMLGPDGKPWQVKLRLWEPGRLFTPADLMREAGCVVTYADLEAGVREAVGRDARRGLGTTAYREVEYHAGGVVDEVAEWLLKQGLVDDTSGTWWRIRCPRWREHTDKDDPWAGYSPLGASGGSVADDRRAFHCFHAHKEGGKPTTDEFLRWVQSEGGPECPARDPVAVEVARWGLDMQANAWVDFRSPGLDRVPDGGFRTGHQETVWVPGVTPTGKDKVRKVSKYQLMVEAPGLLRLHGARYAPGEPAVIRAGDRVMLNECAMPAYGRVTPDSGLVARFVEFVEYLIPDKGQSEWFLSHLAHKVRDPRYRGNAVLMTTPASGTGRGTLADLLAQLFGRANVGTPGWGEFLKCLSGAKAFNTELRRLWIVIEELASGMDPSKARDREHYELLKRFCEPRPVMFEWNRKYGSAWSEPAYASVLLCSNHEDALWADSTDRRFIRIQNPMRARPTSWFMDFRDWMMGSGWEPHVWWWLMERDCGDFVAGENLFLADDRSRRDDIRAAQGVFETLVEFALEYCDAECGGVVHARTLVNALGVVAASVDLSAKQREGARYQLNQMVQNATRAVKHPQSGNYFNVFYEGKTVRFRFTAAGLAAIEDATYEEWSGLCREGWQAFSVEGLTRFVHERFEASGMDYWLNG